MKVKYIISTILVLILLLNNILLFDASGIKTTCAAEKNETYSSDHPEDIYDMVIITPRRFSSALKPLIKHKETYGIKTGLVSLETIFKNFEGRDKQEQIKYFIKYAVENWCIKYVLLVGGVNSLPVRYLWNDDQGRFILADPYFSDLYYADIFNKNGDFVSWDSNSNDKFGEWWCKGRDILDLHPDVYLGRLPCRNILEVNSVVNKIINYERNSYGSPWFKKILLTGGDWEGETLGFYDSDFLAEEVAILMQDKGFDPIRLYSANGNISTSNIYKAINGGVGFAFFTPGDGARTKWSTYVNDTIKSIPFSVPHIKRLNNRNKLPIIVSGGCLLNDIDPKGGYWLPFEKGACWGWTFVKKRNGGAIATIGSNAGCFYREISDFFALLEKTFFETYCRENITFLGELWGKTVSNFLDMFPIRWEEGELEPDGMHCKNVEIFSLIGDPSLKIGGYPLVNYNLTIKSVKNSASTEINIFENASRKNNRKARFSSSQLFYKFGSLSPHDLIYINGDDNFTLENGVVSGDGSVDNPFIIENWQINASESHGIYVTNTNNHFIVRNCLIHSGKLVETPPGYFNDGIRFANVTNGYIKNCTIFENGVGIRFKQCSNCQIEDSHISYNDWGVSLSNSSGNNILECNISDNLEGIRCELSKYSIIKNCTVNDGFWSCIRISYSSDISVENCTIRGNNEGLYRSIGVILYGSVNTRISNSTINTHGFYGIVLSESFDTKSSGNKVVDCNISDCGYAGIAIVGVSTHDLCRHNQFLSCNIHDNEVGILLIRSKDNRVEKCNIHDNIYGIRVNNIGIKIGKMFKMNRINHNNIYNNKMVGLLVETSFLNAKNNWWGSALGPSITRIGGKLGRGDRIILLFGYSSHFPWCIKPI